MRIVDANVLIYAVNSEAQHHAEARQWLDRSLNGGSSVGFSWVALLAFVRIVTHPRLFERPMTTDQAMAQVDAWLTAPAAYAVEPGPSHARVLAQLLGEGGQGGNLVNDAHLAALAIEQRALVVSYDRDFARFPGVEVRSPRDLLS